MKKSLVLLAALFFMSASAEAQCKIVPQGFFLFPDDLKADVIYIEGTWMSVEVPYDPKNPNRSVVRCQRQNYECRVTTAYVIAGDLPILDLWESEYKVMLWDSEMIVAMGLPWVNKQSDEGRPALTIKRSDKSVVEDNSTLVGVLLKPDYPKNGQMVLRQGSPLYNKSLKEFYYGKDKER